MSKKSSLKINKRSYDSKIKSSSKFLGFNLYPPTIIAFVGYIILAITIVLPFEYPVYDEINDTTYIVKYDFSQRILMLLLMTIPIVLSIYSINCMMGGNCILWSYVVSIVTILWVAIFVVSAIVYTFHNRSVVNIELFNTQTTKGPSSTLLEKDWTRKRVNNLIDGTLSIKLQEYYK